MPQFSAAKVQTSRKTKIINLPDKLEFSAFINSRKAETSSHERRLINKSFDAFLFLYFISQRNISSHSNKVADQGQYKLNVHVLRISFYYMAESVFAMRLVNLRSVTCYTDQNFSKKMLISKSLNLGKNVQIKL